MERDIHERHLLRLGFGGKALDTDKDFSKWGRVNYTLARRLELLKEVERLAATLGLGQSAGDIAPKHTGECLCLTCATARVTSILDTTVRNPVRTDSRTNRYLRRYNSVFAVCAAARR